MISIIVPVYNAEQYLDQCIQSILAQSYTDFELLLINDGSTDTSGKICNTYAQRDQRIKVFHQENTGVSVARNFGLDQINGAFVAFIDADDFVEKDYILSLYSAAKNSNADIVCCGYEYISEYTHYTHHDFIELKNNRESFVENLLMNTGGTICSKLFKTSIIKTNNLRFKTELKMREDLIFSLQFSFYSKRFYSVNNYFYKYNGFNENSLSKEDNTENQIYIHKLILTILSKNNFSPIVTSRIINERIKEILFGGIRENIRLKNPINNLRLFFKNKEINQLISELKICSFKDAILYIPAKLRSPLITLIIYKIIYERK